MTGTETTPSLYKYRSLRGDEELTRALCTIAHGEVYFSSRLDFNDPFDCRPHLFTNAKKTEIIEFIEKLISGRHPELPELTRTQLLRSSVEHWDKNSSEIIQQITHEQQQALNKVGIYCLSEDPRHILMWSHYADGHRGICLEFDNSARSFIDNNALQVSYQHKYPSFDLVLKNDDDMTRATFLTKAQEWEHEKEWRIFDHRGSGVRTFPPEALIGVILGAAISPTHEDLVRRTVQRRSWPLKIMKAQIHPNEYRVMFA